jgi:hypothetical protein
MADVFRQFTFELYESDITDIELAHDFFLPSPKVTSEGLRAYISLFSSTCRDGIELWEYLNCRCKTGLLRQNSHARDHLWLTTSSPKMPRSGSGVTGQAALLI